MRIERIDTETMTLAIGLPEQGAPVLVYLGAPLPADCDFAALAEANRDPHWGGLPDAPQGASFLPVSGAGFLGAPGLSVSGPSGPVVMDWRCDRNDPAMPPGGLGIDLSDPETGIDCNLFLEPADGGSIQAWLEFGDGPTEPPHRIEQAAFTLPLPFWAREAITFAGRWAGEWRQQRAPIMVGQRVSEARGGRPGFSAPGFIILCAPETNDDHGPALALHIAHGGEPRVMIEGFETGGGQIQLGARQPMLDGPYPDSMARTPHIALAFSAYGFNGLRAQAPAPHRPADLKVHLNSWEALYFDFDEARLFALVDAAADLGVERFVLDDGWFKGRSDDRRALGDWAPDPDRFPNGLGPLVARVRERGMEFGLWIEPEMVNPDSDLYRAHPDWALPSPLMRNQLALDLGKREVADFVFQTIDRLLTDHPIAYIKWDHNRALFGVGDHRENADQAAIIQRELKSKHPHVVFESCASGGARLHRGQYDWADRFWISDNTDAHARSAMIEALTPFIPLRMIGAHVGASPNPITGRRSDMAFRAKIAMFGHMGVEADPAKMTAAERESLKDHLSLYKRLRHLVADGAFRVGPAPDAGAHLWQLTAPERGEALALAFRLDEAAQPFAPPIRFGGLDPDTDYRLELLEPWPKAAAKLLSNVDFWRERPIFRGALLMQHGIKLPLVHPETAWLIHLERT